MNVTFIPQMYNVRLMRMYYAERAERVSYMKIPRTAVSAVVMAVLEMKDLKRATKYLDDRTTVKCTRQRKFDGRDGAQTVLVTMGKPNYAERAFIKACKNAGEPFPVKKLELKWFKK